MKRSGDWDLNCDLGEGEPISRTRALMRYITSANIACGGHAGDAASMRRTVDLAQEHKVRIGAHPGTWDRESFGRSVVGIDPQSLELLLVHQVGALDAVLRERGARLHHVKLHGGLYHAVESSPTLARRFLQVVSTFWPRVNVYARAGGGVEAVAASLGLGRQIWSEAFLDRGYQADGQLVPRNRPDALLTSITALRTRMEDLCLHRRVGTVEGGSFPLAARTFCVHGDSSHAVSIARWARDYLQRQRESSR